VRPTIPLVPLAQGYSVTIDGVVYRALRRNASDHLLIALGTPFVPTSVGAGQLAVPTAGLGVQLPSKACKAVSIAARGTNTGNIYLGDYTADSTHGRILGPGDAVDLAIDNLSRLYINASVNGDGISYLWVA
jgi:hypothetical protein